MRLKDWGGFGKGGLTAAMTAVKPHKTAPRKLPFAPFSPPPMKTLNKFQVALKLPSKASRYQNLNTQKVILAKKMFKFFANGRCKYGKSGKD